MIKLPKCSFCSDTKQILNSDGNAYHACHHCNRSNTESTDIQESYIMDFDIGKDDIECITRELEDNGVIDEDFTIKNTNLLLEEFDKLLDEHYIKKQENESDKNRDRFFD